MYITWMLANGKWAQYENHAEQEIREKKKENMQNGNQHTMYEMVMCMYLVTSL